MSSSNKMPGRKASAAVFIAVFPPFFFILLIAMLIPEIFPITVRILPLYFLMLFLLALFQTAAADVLFRDYSRMTVAEPVLPLIIGALAVILFRTGSLPERFIPGWDMLLPLTGVFTQVILTSILYHNLREYAV